jgi:hypothetical protein
MEDALAETREPGEVKMRWPLKEALRQPCYLDVLAFLARAPCDRSAPNMDYNGKVIRQHQT